MGWWGAAFFGEVDVALATGILFTSLNTNDQTNIEWIFNIVHREYMYNTEYIYIYIFIHTIYKESLYTWRRCMPVMVDLVSNFEDFNLGFQLPPCKKKTLTQTAKA